MKILKIGGKPVTDSKRNVVLHILPGDVASGRKKRPDCCAAAQACMRQMGAKQARVHLSRVYIERENDWLRFQTPTSLRTEIISFDRGHRFEAGDYTLGKIKPSLKLGKGHKSRGLRPDLGRPGVKAPQRGNRAKPSVVKGVRYSASPAAYA